MEAVTAKRFCHSEENRKSQIQVERQEYVSQNQCSSLLYKDTTAGRGRAGAEHQRQLVPAEHQ